MYYTELGAAYGVRGSFGIYGPVIIVKRQLLKYSVTTLIPTVILTCILYVIIPLSKSSRNQERDVLPRGCRIKHNNTRRTGTQRYSN